MRKNFNFWLILKKNYEMDDDTLKKHSSDLEIFLSDGEEKDISAIELVNEINVFKDICKKDENLEPLNIIRYIYSNNLENVFVNLTIAFRILLTFPVSVATGERSFSKLKLIKTYLRSTISQERLVGLALISIEKELCDKLDVNKIIEKFASIKARKINL